MTPILPLALAFISTRTSNHHQQKLTHCLSKTITNTNLKPMSNIASLPPLLSTDGTPVSPDETLSDKLKNKRVALYFAAGWCGMCRRFEPDLLKFREESAENNQEVEIIYVPSDRSQENTLSRTKEMNMMSVPFGKEADEIKLKYKIWSGSESGTLGTGRRSGVPAIVVLDNGGEEMAFLPAESEGAKALGSWPLEFKIGIW